MKPRLHIFGLPHTITRDEFSHCAFTGKVQRFSPMMRSVGYHVTHYGVQGAESGADEQVDVLTREDWLALCDATREAKGLQPLTGAAFYSDLADVGSVLYKVFNARLAQLLRERVTDKRDILCLPFGHAHADAIAGLPNSAVETGIGYNTTCANLRVFESYAWQAFHAGKSGDANHDYTWVIPNYYDLDAWPAGDGRGGYALFFGRICAVKGLGVIREMALRRPHVRFVLCGQGDPAPWLVAPNIEAIPPVHGAARAKLLGDAAVVLAPSQYLEPFCGSVVEAALTGTPAITSDHGAFGETIQQNVTGVRCKTLGDYLAALDLAMMAGLGRGRTRSRAQGKYGMYELAHSYDRVFRQVDDLWGAGWFATRSQERIAPDVVA